MKENQEYLTLDEYLTPYSYKTFDVKALRSQDRTQFPLLRPGTIIHAMPSAGKSTIVSLATALNVPILDTDVIIDSLVTWNGLRAIRKASIKGKHRNDFQVADTRIVQNALNIGLFIQRVTQCVLVTNVVPPEGLAQQTISFGRVSETLWEILVARAEAKKKKLSLTKEQVASWSEDWLKQEFKTKVVLGENEYLSDAVFPGIMGIGDFAIDAELSNPVFARVLRQFTLKAGFDLSGFLALPAWVQGHPFYSNGKIPLSSLKLFASPANSQSARTGKGRNRKLTAE